MLEVLDTASRDPDARRQLADPYTLTTDRGAEPEIGRQPDLPWRRGRQIAPELTGLWTSGFLMAPYNTRIVRRSNALLDWAYGRQLRYSESMSLGSSPLAPVASAVVGGVGAATFGLGSRYFRLLPRKLVERIVPKPGTGPSDGRPRTRLLPDRDVHHYNHRRALRGAHGAARRPGLQGDVGAVGGVRPCSGADRDKLPDLHGVLTPAAAMGDALLDRFPGVLAVTLEVERLGL